MDVQEARERLETMLAELDGSAAVLTRENTDPGELSTVDQHPADSATNLADADREQASLEVVQRQIKEVREALKRIDDATYGKCVDCGTPLPPERLEARPEAARCVSCQQRLEAAR